MFLEQESDTHPNMLFLAHPSPPFFLTGRGQTGKALTATPSHEEHNGPMRLGDCDDLNDQSRCFQPRHAKVCRQGPGG